MSTVFKKHHIYNTIHLKTHGAVLHLYKNSTTFKERILRKQFSSYQKDNFCTKYPLFLHFWFLLTLFLVIFFADNNRLLFGRRSGIQMTSRTNMGGGRCCFSLKSEFDMMRHFMDAWTMTITMTGDIKSF